MSVGRHMAEDLALQAVIPNCLLHLTRYSLIPLCDSPVGAPAL